MTLLIACLLIAGFDFHWAFYIIAVLAWLFHIGFHGGSKL